MKVPQILGAWKKSSYSAQQTNCVEVAKGEQVRVRDTKDRTSGHLTLPAASWKAFLDRL
jgi:hypothetical protein